LLKLVRGFSQAGVLDGAAFFEGMFQKIAGLGGFAEAGVGRKKRKIWFKGSSASCSRETRSSIWIRGKEDSASFS
jgi:hypothetical protein